MRLFSFSFILVSLFCVFSLCDGARVFDVYRLLQYDQGHAQFGSRRATIDHLAATSNVKSEKLSKYIIVLQLEELTQTPDLIQKLLNRHVSGILIVLPEDPTSVDLAAWSPIETQLAQTLIDIPVWMTYGDAHIKELIQELQHEEGVGLHQPSLLMGDSYKLSVPPIEGQLVKAVETVNLQATLPGAKQDAPTIAIVTHYDAFSIAPELARDVSGSASSMSALLELARLFSKLDTKNPKTQSDYNLVFLATGAANFNFTGTTHFLNSVDSRVLDSVEFVLCLDSIGREDGLTLHVSRSPAKDSTAKRIYDMFDAVAQQMGIPFSVVQKKVNTTSDHFPWQHEHFSMKRILAGTLSGYKTVSALMSRSNLFDVKPHSHVLAKNVKFIAESLARIIYKIPANSSAKVFEDSLSVSEQYLSSWTNTIGSVPRMLPFLTKDSHKKLLITGLEKELKRFISDVTKVSFIIPSNYGRVYYDQMVASMSGYRSKHVVFDIVFSVCLIVVFGLFYASLKGFKETIRGLQNAIYGTKKR